jgi:hypothetical protein
LLAAQESPEISTKKNCNPLYRIFVSLLRDNNANIAEDVLSALPVIIAQHR